MLSTQLKPLACTNSTSVPYFHPSHSERPRASNDSGEKTSTMKCRCPSLGSGSRLSRRKNSFAVLYGKLWNPSWVINNNERDSLPSATPGRI